MNNETTVMPEQETPTLSFRDGKTTVVIGMHFQTKGKDLEDKIKSIIREEVKRCNL